jgi:hypothetical protein
MERAIPVMGLLALLMFSPTVFDSPGVLTDSTLQISLTASGVTAENPIPSTTVVRAGYEPTRSQSTGGYPLRRRRRIHFWNNWTHYGGRAGPLRWILLTPLFAITIVVVAVLLLSRGRRRRRQAGRNLDGQPSGYTAPTSGAQVLTQESTPTTYVPTRVEQATDDRLSRLSALHASGVLTDEEFETQRRRILGG